MQFRAVLAALFCHALASAQAATFTVNTTSDSGPGSLRQCILDANATPGDDSIVFATNGTISLASRLPLVSDNTCIVGPGTNQLTISGNNAVQVFSFSAGTTNTLSGVAIANGLASGHVNGAGIANAGDLTISNCALVNNQTFGGWGGALFNSGNLGVISSVFSGNQVTGEDGGLYSRNWAAGGGGAGIGGGLFTMSGTAFIYDCCFTGNNATGGNGGGGGPVSNTATGTGRGGGVNGAGPGGDGGFGGGGGAGAYCGAGGTSGFGGGGGGGGECDAGSPSGGQGANRGGSGGFGAIVGVGSGGGGAGLGGGIFVHSGEVTVLDCSFTNNEASGGLGGAAGPTWGGGANGTGIGADFLNMAGTVSPSLTLTTAGGGTLRADPAGPPCLNDSTVTITATPAPGWTLLQWLGDAQGTNSPISLKINRSKFVQAIFGTQVAYSAPVSASPQSTLYPYGTVVKLTATPPQGAFFASWAGDASGTNNPTTLTIVNANVSISCQLGTLGLGETSP